MACSPNTPLVPKVVVGSLPPNNTSAPPLDLHRYPTVLPQSSPVFSGTIMPLNFQQMPQEHNFFTAYPPPPPPGFFMLPLSNFGTPFSTVPLPTPQTSAPSGAYPVMPKPSYEEIDDGPKQLIVNFLDSQVTNIDLHEAFNAIGPLDAVRVIYDKTTNKSKGFGFVYFKHSADASKAMQCMSGHPLRGKRIKVSYASPQRPHTAAPDGS